MSPATYHGLFNLAGRWGLIAIPDRVDIVRGCSITFSAAIYIAVDAIGNVDYVGSVCRPDSVAALNDRIREHLRDRRRADRWAYLHVIPLLPATPLREVRRIEGEVARILEPTRNARMPRALAWLRPGV